MIDSLLTRRPIQVFHVCWKVGATQIETPPDGKNFSGWQHARRVPVPRSRSPRRGRANEAEPRIVDGAITATSTAILQTV